MMQANKHQNSERRAEEASRSVETWLKCHYMQKHIGEQYTATITTVTGFGLFVTLNDLYIDGLAYCVFGSRIL